METAPIGSGCVEGLMMKMMVITYSIYEGSTTWW